jgi:hypothetical protein
MCWSCFKKYADAPIVNDRVLAVYRMIRDSEEDEAEYSRLLHIMVSDMNLDDYWFEDGGYSQQTYDDVSDRERDIFNALKDMSEAERATAVAMDWGFIFEDGSLRSDIVE